MKTLIAILIILGVGTGIYFYATRPAEAPEENKASDEIVLNNEEQVTEENKDTSSPKEMEKYVVSSSDSKVTYTIDEELRGSPFTVIGSTTNISGEITYTAEPKPVITIGTIKVAAGTFKTDSAQRDGAVARFILKSEDSGKEFITFAPNGPITLSAKLEEGKSASFPVSGKLTISGITKPETFNISVTRKNKALDAEITGDLKRSDFNLVIPNIPFVAKVPDTFNIKADVIAKIKN